MNHDEALTVTEMVVNCWPDGRFWTPEQISMYARGIQHLEAGIATRAVERAQRTMTHRPTVADMTGICRSMAVNATTISPSRGYEPLPAKPTKMPGWVREWICARYLYASFGREQDMRRFTEMQDWGDPNMSLMPPGAWANEAASLSDGRAWSAFRNGQ